jgi:hypothetical protein
LVSGGDVRVNTLCGGGDHQLGARAGDAVFADWLGGRSDGFDLRRGKRGVSLLGVAICWGNSGRSQPFVWAIVWTIAFSIAAASLMHLALAGRSHASRPAEVAKVDQTDDSVLEFEQSANSLAGVRVPS